MTKKRHKNHRGLPKGWRFKHGAYRYRVPLKERHLWDNKTEVKLGENLHDAYRTWADTHQFMSAAKIFRDIFDRYALEVISKRNPSATYQAQLILDRLRQVFGDMLPQNLKPMHIYQYYDLRSKKKPDHNGRMVGGHGAAARDITMLSDVCNYAIRWGIIDRHPFKGQVTFQKQRKLQHYVEDDDEATGQRPPLSILINQPINWIRPLQLSVPNNIITPCIKSLKCLKAHIPFGPFLMGHYCPAPPHPICHETIPNRCGKDS